MKIIKFLVLILSLSGCLSQPYHKEVRLMLGTIVEITCQDRAAIASAFEEIKKIEAIANNFNPDSEISKLNAGGWFRPVRTYST